MSSWAPTKYKTTNWSSYNEALKQRGSLTIWFDPDMVWKPPLTGKRGRQLSFSDAAIQTCLTMKVLFGMPLRQTTGFMQSLLRLVGMDWTVPDFSTLCRRQRTLNVSIPYRGSTGPPNLVIDSTGIKAEGEGEWNARKHGGPKRRIWRKIHIGIDEETLEVRAVEITGSNIGDATVLPDLLDQIPADEQIGSVTADGAYDTRKCHEQSPLETPLLSFHHARMPDPGSPRARVPSHAMTPCAPRSTWAQPFVDDGAATITKAVSRQR